MFTLLSCWKWKEGRKYKLSKLSIEPAYTKSRNHNVDWLRKIENTSSLGKHYALNCWITLHFNVQICSLAFCWKDQTIWHFVWQKCIRKMQYNLLKCIKGTKNRINFLLFFLIPGAPLGHLIWVKPDSKSFSLDI